MYAIEVKNVHKIYNLYNSPKDILKETIFGGTRHTEFPALKGVSFNVKNGDVYGVVGSNGSGKSTVLSIINGTTFPTKGKVKCDKRVSLLNVGAGIIPSYTGYENITYKCTLYGMNKRQIEKKMKSIVEFSELGEFLKQPVKSYSSGMRSKLGFAIAIHVEPEVLIIDEALAVGDSKFQAKCHDKMNELKTNGITILYVSHSAGAVKKFCNNCCWIDKGEVIAKGKAADVTQLYEQFMKNKKTLKEVQQLVLEKPSLYWIY